MQITNIYDIAPNGDGKNYRIRELISKWNIGNSINIQLYKTVNNTQEAVKELKNWFKYWYNSITREWKHHKWITVSCFYED